MFQKFTSTTHPDQGPPRLEALRKTLAEQGLDGVLVPRSDAHQGEYVAPRDERLAWLTGFTGSAGFCIVLPHSAGLFVDGRYQLQARSQCNMEAFTPVAWPETKPADWLRRTAVGPLQIGFDPWLHTVGEIETLRRALKDSDITLVETENPIDKIWTDQPLPPSGKVSAYPVTLAGQSASEKCAALAETLRAAQHRAAILTLPDSIAWLLNIRGSDISHNPVAHGFAILNDDASVDLFMEAAKLSAVIDTLGDKVRIHSPADLSAALQQLEGRVRLDKASASVAVHGALTAGPAEIVYDRDPCLLPKACKHPSELKASAAAHLRDAAAMVEFLAWVETATDALCAGGPTLSEIDVVTKLEGFREATGALKDISFDTICGAGPNGAIVHYRVTEETNRTLAAGELLLVDSGGQYVDGTTDITRTLSVGPAGAEERDCYTRVLRGLIAMSKARFPKGIAGRDLDVLARMPLWQVGRDYGHGTGHGVGQYLSVHEGPQRLSRQGTEPLQPGMILSNEPGYYREGAFGIRLENLIVVTDDDDLPPGDTGGDMLSFETLTYVPFDRRLIDTAALSPEEKRWIDEYHQETFSRLTGALSPAAQTWLETATAQL